MSRVVDTVCSEPYRLFFPLAVVIGLVGVGHWAFYYLGWSDSYSGFLHASIQLLPHMGCFVIGFLLTAMPRMTGARTATPKEISFFLLATLAMFFMFLTAKPIAAEVCFLIWLALLARFFAIRISEVRAKKKKTNQPALRPPVAFVWVPIAIVCGFIGTTTLVLGQLGLFAGKTLFFAEKLMQQGFILAIVTGVGGFLGSRLTGRFRAQKKSGSVCSPQEANAFAKRDLIIHLVGGLLFFLSFVIEGFFSVTAAYGLRATILTFFFFRSGVLPLWPRVSDFFAWLIWISFWMVALGLWGPFFHDTYRKASLHVSFLGGLSLMTFAVATMVILSHAGQTEKLRKPLPILWLIAVGIFVSLGVRIYAVFSPEHYFMLLSISSGVWMAAAFAWLVFALFKVTVVISPDEVEAGHERAKQRIINLRNQASTE